MLVHPHPITAPGHCNLCRSELGPVVDTLQDDQWVGRKYICFACCRHLGELAGMVTAESVDALKGENILLIDALTEAQREAELQRAAAEALIAAGYEKITEPVT